MTGSFLAKRVLVALLACVMSSTLAAYGQSTFGSIVGTVKDQSGSVVPGAIVTLVNVGSSAKHTATTSASGGYEFLNLDAGTYQVEIQASGFKDQVFDHLVLQADAGLRMAIRKFFKRGMVENQHLYKRPPVRD